MDAAAQLDPTLAVLGDQAITIDLRDVTFIDSTGLRSLLLAHRRGVVVLREPSDVVRRILEVAGVADLLVVEQPTD
jgi:anti-anti-sigma factor